MGRIHQICDILTLAERHTRASCIAQSTLAHRARRSSTWLDRAVTKASHGRPVHLYGDTKRAAALRLGPSGQIASPVALCRALWVRRSVYYAVVRRYRDEIGAKRWPQAGSDSERMLIALSASGDARFASRRTRTAA